MPRSRHHFPPTNAPVSLTKREHAIDLCKTLTTVLHALQPQMKRSTSGEVDSSNSQLYNHLAMLLTRGTEDGGKGRSVIAVAGGKCTATAMATDALGKFDSSLEESLSHPHFVVAQNQREEQPWHLEKVKPSKLTLSYIIENLSSDENSTRTLFTHASYLLTALQSTQNVHETSAKHGNLVAMMLEFVLRSCHPKLMYRFENTRRIFRKPIPVLLQQWTLNSVEDLLNFSCIGRPDVADAPESADESEVWIPAPPSITDALFAAYTFQPTLHNHKKFYQLDAHTAPTLVKILACAYDNALKAVLHYDSSEDPLAIKNFVSSMEILYQLYYHLIHYFDIIFELPSLKRLLSVYRGFSDRTTNERKMKQGETTSTKPSAASSTSAEDSDRIELHTQSDETPGKTLTRHLRLVLSWNRATYRLHESRLFRSGLDVTLHIIKTPIGPNLKRLLSAEQLIQELGIDEPSPSPLPDETKKLMKQRIYQSIKYEFSGAVHCEAMMMSLMEIVERKSSSISDKWLNQFKDSNRAIGVAKKACSGCDILRQELSTEIRGPNSTEEDAFDLPGTSGVIFPWAPPYGISDEVLERINTVLKKQLINVLQRHKLDKYSSRQSSPPSADGEPTRTYPQDKNSSSVVPGHSKLNPQTDVLSRSEIRRRVR